MVSQAEDIAWWCGRKIAYATGMDKDIYAAHGARLLRNYQRDYSGGHTSSEQRLLVDSRAC